MLSTMALCVALTCLGGEPETQTQPQPQPQPQAQDQLEKLELLEIEQNILVHTNAQRARFGLASLEIDRSLMNTARQHASWMASTQNLVHTRHPVAENIAMGQASSQEAVQDWMNSSGHRANILNGGHRRIGVAAYRTIHGTIFWCQQFLP